MPADAKPARTKDLKELQQTMIALRELFLELEDSGAGVKLMLVDACRDDPRLGRNVAVDNLPRPARGTAALFSCKGGERAFETPKLGAGHGVFFHHVLEGLKGKAKNDKGEVTWSRLAEYVIDKVSDDVPVLIGGGASQTPQEVRNIIGRAPVLVSVGGAGAPKAGGGPKVPASALEKLFAAREQNLVTTQTLLTSQSVQGELQLDSHQRSGIQSANASSSDPSMKGYARLTATKVLRSLSAAQLKRLSEIEVRYYTHKKNPLIFSRSDVLDQVGLTADQRTAVAAILEEHTTFVAGLQGERLTWGQSEAKKQARRKADYDRILATFTEAQKRTWEAMAGKPFDVSGIR